VDKKKSLYLGQLIEKRDVKRKKLGAAECGTYFK